MEPMLKVAARFGVSSSYMARICALMNVPRPERGYWAKLAVGKVQKKPALPEPNPGDQLSWSRDGTQPQIERPLPQPAARKKHTKSTATNRPAQHPLLNGVKTLFESGRLSYEGEYLKPSKRLLVDLAVSKTGLENALSFANQLFLALEDYGYRVTFAPVNEHLQRASIDVREKPSKNSTYNNLWSPARITVVYIGTVAIGLTIIEMSEEKSVRYVKGKYIREDEYVPPKNWRNTLDYSWTTNKTFSTGQLCLQAYSPYARANWVTQWKETTNRDLITQVKSIIRELEHAAVEIARLVEEGAKQAKLELEKWEAQREKWRRDEAERKASQDLKDSKDDLYRIIERWAEANRIEQFFSDALHKAALLNAEERDRLMERLRKAREIIGSANALDHFLAWKAPEER